MFTLDGFSIVDADAPEEIVGRRRRQHGAVTSACGCREREKEKRLLSTGEELVCWLDTSWV